MPPATSLDSAKTRRQHPFASGRARRTEGCPEPPQDPRVGSPGSWGTRFIVGGDLNTGRSLGTAYAPKYGHGDFWNEIDAGILKEAFPGGNEERQSYWGHGDDNKGPTGNTLQDDHVFFDAETFKLVTQSRVWDTPQVRGLSDHGPIVVDLSVTVEGDI